MKEINPNEIKAEMALHGISNVQVAKELGLCRASITHALSTGKNTGYKTLNRIIAAVNKLKQNA